MNLHLLYIRSYLGCTEFYASIITVIAEKKSPEGIVNILLGIKLQVTKIIISGIHCDCNIYDKRLGMLASPVMNISWLNWLQFAFSYIVFYCLIPFCLVSLCLSSLLSFSCFSRPISHSLSPCPYLSYFLPSWTQKGCRNRIRTSASNYKEIINGRNEPKDCQNYVRIKWKHERHYRTKRWELVPHIQQHSKGFSSEYRQQFNICSKVQMHQNLLILPRQRRRWLRLKRKLRWIIPYVDGIMCYL